MHELNLRLLLDDLGRAKWVIMGAALGGVMIAAGYVLLAPEIFRSEALVMPRQESTRERTLQAAAELLSPNSVTVGGDRSLAIATLKSRSLIEGFITEQGLLPEMYPDSWDNAAKRWKDDRNAPTAWQAYRDFVKRILFVSEDRATGFITVAVEWRDPSLARDWVTKLIQRTNAHLRAEAIREGERNIAYLESEAGSISQVELRQALFGLMEAEMKRLMLAKGREDYALKTIDPAVVPLRRSRPNPKLALTLGLIVGLFGSVGVVLLKRTLSEVRAA